MVQERVYTINREHRDFVQLKVNGDVFAKVLYLEKETYMVVVYDRYTANFRTAEEALNFAKKVQPVFEDLMGRGKFWGHENPECPQAEKLAPSLALNLKAMISLCEDLLKNIEETDVSLFPLNVVHYEQLSQNIQSELPKLERDLLAIL